MNKGALRKMVLRPAYVGRGLFRVLGRKVEFLPLKHATLKIVDLRKSEVVCYPRRPRRPSATSSDKEIGLVFL